jgi:hypothetical protein
VLTANSVREIRWWCARANRPQKQGHQNAKMPFGHSPNGIVFTAALSHGKVV